MGSEMCIRDRESVKEWKLEPLLDDALLVISELVTNAVTTAWGLEDVPGEGKLVWAELARPADASGSVRPAR